MKRWILLTCCLLGGLFVEAQEKLTRGKEYYQWGEYARALPYLQQAAKEGYGEACYLLGNMYYRGNGTEQNYTIARRMFERGLEFGFPDGEAELGLMYENGEGCQQDAEKARALYSSSSEKGNLYGRYLLARHCFYAKDPLDRQRAYTLLEGLYGNADFKRSYKWAHSWVCVFLGICCRDGRGTESSPAKAIDYFVESWNPDFLYAASHVARYYSITRQGRDWKDLLRQAVWKGNKEGKVLYEYARLELEERNGQIDRTTFERLEQAAQSYPRALKLLGDCYRDGHGVPVNRMKADEYYAKAESHREEIEREEAAERRLEEQIAEARRQEQAQREADRKRAEQEQQQAEERRRQARREAAARYKVGDLYTDGSSRGVVIKRTEEEVLIISSRESFGSCPDYSDKDGWRMPTIEELRYIMSNRDLVNKCLAAQRCGQLRQGVYYWSSTVGSKPNLRIASNGSEIIRDYSNKNYIRLVRDH